MHTPGPWSLLDGEHNGRWVIKSQPEPDDEIGIIVALVPVGPRHNQSGPNARLIATAPELLQAAKLVLEMAGHYSNDYFDQFDAKILNQLKNSVAKAEQESE